MYATNSPDEHVRESYFDVKPVSQLKIKLAICNLQTFSISTSAISPPSLHLFLPLFYFSLPKTWFNHVFLVKTMVQPCFFGEKHGLAMFLVKMKNMVQPCFSGENHGSTMVFGEKHGLAMFLVKNMVQPCFWCGSTMVNRG